MEFCLFTDVCEVAPYTDVGRLAGQLRDYPSRSLANENVEIRMLPIGDVRYRLKDEAPFTLNFIRLFVVAGILLLFSALFNFLNLHLDLFRQRMRELRLRAVNGASGGQLSSGKCCLNLTCVYLFGVASGLLFGGGCQSGLFRILGISMEMPRGIRAFCLCGVGVMLLVLLVGSVLFWRLSGWLSGRGRKGRRPGNWACSA